jgi:hypothetical protein
MGFASFDPTGPSAQQVQKLLASYRVPKSVVRAFLGPEIVTNWTSLVGFETPEYEFLLQ